ncbi:MBOAT family O-acyltransferase [Cetobacterium sp.]|uniref:MBOAT family O-acyltransferase n=1 Tax=Cetobacterium sp. TaxID=2071632 RepID=UPI003F39D5B0
MNFNSINFLVFYTIITFIYFIIKPKYRWILLLLGSYYFYSYWSLKYTLLMFLSTVITYCSGLLIEKTKYKKISVLMSFLINLCVLFFFKYFNFFNSNLKSTLSLFDIDYNVNSLKIILPVGISFYTFQALSYTMDVYRGEIKAEKHFGRYALFVSYFPQLVAGPIERSQHLLPQLQKETKFDYNNLKTGLLLMLVGFFKKVVIADRAALLVNNVYGDLNNVPPISVIIASVFFSIQIYCDFSAYSDIARGASRILGIELMKNFDRPYYSKNISQFWRKWHISLGTWFREYLYIPLGGNKVSKIKVLRNIAIVFVISGLWHGASWNFIIWGALHGAYVILEIFLKNSKDKLLKFLRIKNGFKDSLEIITTFCLVNFAWIFFRAESFEHSKKIISKIFEIFTNFSFSFNFKMSLADLLILIFGILLLEIYHYCQKNISKILNLPDYLRYSLYYTATLLTLLLGKYGHSEFIYFQF